MRRFVIGSVVLLSVNGLVSSAGAQAKPAPKPPAPVSTSETLYRLNPLTVFQALEKTWNSAGLKEPAIDTKNFTMTYTGAPMPLKVGNSGIERLMDCGGDKKSPLAKTTPLTMTVRSVVTRTDEGAKLATTVSASPVDSMSMVVCISTTVLEKKLEPSIANTLMSRH